MINKVSITPNRELCKALCCTQRYQVLIVAGVLFFMIASFITGYFWGVGSALEQISTQLDQEAFSDQISASLIPMQMSDDEREEQCQDDTADHDIDESPVTEEQDQQMCAERTYYAQLAGFGNKQSAYRFAQKLIKKKIPVIVNPIHSRTMRGKSITWYQVVTESYSTKEELVALVEQLKETERLKDPQIVHS
jgi:SPOR domain